MLFVSGQIVSGKDDAAFESLKATVASNVTDVTAQPRKRKAPPILAGDVGGGAAAVSRHRKPSVSRKPMTKEDRWAKHHYVSAKLFHEVDVPEPERDSHAQLLYRQGNVADPCAVEGTRGAIIVHCVDNSGEWTNRGVFRALSELSPAVEKQYTLAGEMKDLHVGDMHLITVPAADAERLSAEVPMAVHVALVVTYRRDREGVLSDFKVDSFREGLVQIAGAALHHKASVHLPRFGLKPDQWYSIERMIRKELVARGVNAVIYYYPRSHLAATTATGRRASRSSDESTGSSGAAPAPRTIPTSPSAPAPAPPPPPPPPKDLFQDLAVCILATPAHDQQKRQLTRYVLAYGGDVVERAEDASHVVILDDVSLRCCKWGIVSSYCVVPSHAAPRPETRLDRGFHQTGKADGTRPVSHLIVV